MARRTLTRWKQVGFFQDNEGRTELDPRIGRIDADDMGALRAALLRLVLAPENNPMLTDDAVEDNDRSRASDYTFAAAWVLMQDPYSFVAKYRDGVEGMQSSQGVAPPPFSNDTRWAGFVEWASFLGLAWSAVKVGLVLDPAFAVRVFLDDIYAGASELPQETFLGRLSDALPIVDGGQYQVAVQSRTARPWRAVRANEVSPCLSAALLTLEAQGHLRLESRSDAPQRTLLGREGRELSPVSHLVRLGGA